MTVTDPELEADVGSSSDFHEMLERAKKLAEPKSGPTVSAAASKDMPFDVNTAIGPLALSDAGKTAFMKAYHTAKDTALASATAMKDITPSELEIMIKKDGLKPFAKELEAELKAAGTDQTKLDQLDARIIGLGAGVDAVQAISAATIDPSKTPANFVFTSKDTPDQIRKALVDAKPGDTAAFPFNPAPNQFLIREYKMGADGSFYLIDSRTKEPAANLPGLTTSALVDKIAAAIAPEATPTATAASQKKIPGIVDLGKYSHHLQAPSFNLKTAPSFSGAAPVDGFPSALKRFHFGTDDISNGPNLTDGGNFNSDPFKGRIMTPLSAPPTPASTQPDLPKLDATAAISMVVKPETTQPVM